MKREVSIFERIVDRRTLSAASHRASKGKRNRKEVIQFFDEFDSKTERIIFLLKKGAYRFSEYRTFQVRDTKSRQIFAPPFVDRVVHHAMMIGCGTVFERGACFHSYACRTGKGHHSALKQASRWVRSSNWFLKVDICKFYDSVDHELLRLMLRRRFGDDRVLALFDRLIDSYSTTLGKGIPIGALTSQYLANFFLDTVDRWAKQTMRIRRYIRYMDDMVFFGQEEPLRVVHRAVDSFLNRLELKRNTNTVLNRCEVGLPFLGFVIFPQQIKLNQKATKRLRVKLNHLRKSLKMGVLNESDFQARSQSLLAHAKPCTFPPKIRRQLKRICDEPHDR